MLALLATAGLTPLDIIAEPVICFEAGGLGILGLDIIAPELGGAGYLTFGFIF